MTAKRLKNLVLSVVTNPFNLIVLISLVMLICLVAVPLVSVLKTTFTLARAEARRAGGQVGDFTLYYWKYLFASKLSMATFWRPLSHSLLISFFTCLIAVPFGSIMAWLMVRSDLPGKSVLFPADHRAVYDPVVVQVDGVAVGFPQCARRLPGLP